MPNINTTPPRNVIYYNANTNPLSDIANTAYTDVIVGFLVPATNPDGSWLVNPPGSGGDGSPGAPGIVLQSPPDPNGTLVSDIQTLHSAHKNVLISVGGAAGWFNSNLSQSQQNAYALCAAVPGGAEALALQIVGIVGYYGFDGVDIDYEDGTGFDGTGGYDGAQFLIDLTLNLSARLSGRIITHAPQTPYWDPTSQWQGKYVQVWQQVGNQITWFNNQFYNQDATHNNIAAYYPQIAKIVPSEKMLVGTPLSINAASSGFIGDVAMTKVIAQLAGQYLVFGGAMGWEFSFDTPNGAWGNAIGQALASTGGGFISPPPPPPGGTSGSWNVNDLTAATNAPAAAGDPDGYEFTANGTSGMHVVYRGVDNDIHELYWQNGAWGVNDLTAATNAPAAAGDPNGFTFTANGTSGMHVVYRGADDDIHELYWQNGAWGVNDLTAATDAPAAAGDPNGFAFTANGTSGMHVVYRGDDNDIHELYWQNGAWGVNDLTATTGAPAAAGDPNGFAFTANGTSGMHVVYRGADNDIHELYWQNGAWSVNDLTATTGAPAAAGDPNGFAFTANGTSGMHVVYRGADNDIHELYWQNGAWGVNDLTAATGAPAAAGDPNGYAFTANGTSGMHVVYRGADNDIHELYWQNGAWGVNDLTAGTNAPAAEGDPNGYVFDAQEQMHVVYPSADGHIDEFWWAPASTSSAARKRAVNPSRDAKGAMGKAPAEA